MAISGVRLFSALRTRSDRGLTLAGAWPFWAGSDGTAHRGTPSRTTQVPFSDADLAQNILVVEDEILIAWMVESLLEEAGFRSIRLATSASDALASAREHAPAVIISDINLGAGDDGIAAATRIRETVAAPVIFVSAYLDDAARHAIANDIGDAVILRKPVEQRALLAALREVLTRSSQH